MSLPTSVEFCRRQPQRSWRHELHDHSCRAEVRPGSGERREYPEWRRPGCGDDPSTARNGWLPLYDKTADRVEAGRCMTTNVSLHDTPRRGVAIYHCEVQGVVVCCQPQPRRRGYTCSYMFKLACFYIHADII